MSPFETLLPPQSSPSPHSRLLARQVVVLAVLVQVPLHGAEHFARHTPAPSSAARPRAARHAPACAPLAARPPAHASLAARPPSPSAMVKLVGVILSWHPAAAASQTTSSATSSPASSPATAHTLLQVTAAPTPGVLNALGGRPPPPARWQTQRPATGVHAPVGPLPRRSRPQGRGVGLPTPVVTRLVASRGGGPTLRWIGRRRGAGLGRVQKGILVISRCRAHKSNGGI